MFLLIAHTDVSEIMVDGPDAIFVKRHTGPSGYHDEVFHDDEHVVRTLTKILDDASGSHRKLDAAEGLQDAQLDTGARIHIVHGDVATHTVVCTSTNVPAGAQVGFVIEAQVNGSVGTITNMAPLTSTTPDPVAANNTDAVNVVIKGGTQDEVATA